MEEKLDRVARPEEFKVVCFEQSSKQFPVTLVLSIEAFQNVFALTSFVSGNSGRRSFLLISSTSLILSHQ